MNKPEAGVSYAYRTIQRNEWAVLTAADDSPNYVMCMIVLGDYLTHTPVLAGTPLQSEDSISVPSPRVVG